MCNILYCSWSPEDNSYWLYRVKNYWVDDRYTFCDKWNNILINLSCSLCCQPIKYQQFSVQFGQNNEKAWTTELMHCWKNNNIFSSGCHLDVIALFLSGVRCKLVIALTTLMSFWTSLWPAGKYTDSKDWPCSRAIELFFFLPVCENKQQKKVY